MTKRIQFKRAATVAAALVLALVHTHCGSSGGNNGTEAAGSDGGGGVDASGPSGPMKDGGPSSTGAPDGSTGPADGSVSPPGTDAGSMTRDAGSMTGDAGSTAPQPSLGNQYDGARTTTESFDASWKFHLGDVTGAAGHHVRRLVVDRARRPTRLEHLAALHAELPRGRRGRIPERWRRLVSKDVHLARGGAGPARLRPVRRRLHGQHRVDERHAEFAPAPTGSSPTSATSRPRLSSGGRTSSRSA